MTDQEFINELKRLNPNLKTNNMKTTKTIKTEQVEEVEITSTKYFKHGEYSPCYVKLNESSCIEISDYAALNGYSVFVNPDCKSYTLKGEVVEITEAEWMVKFENALTLIKAIL